MVQYIFVSHTYSGVLIILYNFQYSKHGSVFAGRGHKQTTRTNAPTWTLASSTHFIFVVSLIQSDMIRLTCGMYRDIYKIYYNTDLVELFNTTIQTASFHYR